MQDAAAAGQVEAKKITFDPQRAVLGHREVIKDTIELVYQTPEEAFQIPAKAVMFFAHGCSHSATDCFDKGEGCQKCIGLPIERTLVSNALSRGFIVVAVSSVNRMSKCWSGKPDVSRVMSALEHVGKKVSMEGLPVAAVGASSGGRFVWELGNRVQRVKAVAVQIMGVDSDRVTENSPATIFWHMPRDRRTAHNNKEAVEEFTARKRPVLELTCNPQPLAPSLFTSRMASLSAAAAESIVGALRAAALLDDQGYLHQDPRRSEWREALASVPDVASLGLEADKSSVSELMNVAWAAHEFCDESYEEALDFLAHYTLNCSTKDCAPPTAL